MEYVYTSAEVFGILIEEPMTSLTDFITGIVGVVSYFRLRKLGFQDKAHIWFKYYFLFIGIATLCAGVLGHATQYIVGFNAKTIGWTFSALALFCLENSGLSYYQKEYGEKKMSWLRSFFLLQLIAHFIFVVYPPTRVFTLVKINAFIGMVIIALPLFYFTSQKSGTRGSWMVVLAIIASCVPGIVFSAEFSLHI